MHELFVKLAVALGIGALMGFEREQSGEGAVFAGSRTFPLAALLGAVVEAFFPELRLGAFAFLAFVTALAYGGKIWLEEDPGLTTAVAFLLAYVLGSLATHPAAGITYTVVIGTVVTALLASKRRLHGLADAIEPRERRAMLTVLVLALVVLPLLPDRPLDALLGLNPRFIWLMVVFISGIELVAYLLIRWVGPRSGLSISGVLGGLVSSTATAVSMASRAKETPNLSEMAALAAAVSSLVMLPRVLLEVAVVNPGLLWAVGLPVGGMVAVGVGVVVVRFWRFRDEELPASEVENPFHLRRALGFGALFAVILLAVERGNELFGETAVYATALISGLADVDAITLSMSRLAGEGQLASGLAATGIVLAVVANTAVKAGIAWVLGSRRMGREITIVLGAVVLVGLGSLLVL